MKQALNELDNELSRRYTYSAARQDKIDSLKAIANSYPEGTDRRLASLMELGDLYNGYLADSARVVYERAEQEARESDHPDRETRFMLKKLVNMTLTGFGPEAAQRFSAISTDGMPDSLKYAPQTAGNTSIRIRRTHITGKRMSCVPQDIQPKQKQFSTTIWKIRPTARRWKP